MRKKILKLAKEQSSENPVYYVQYAHARGNSVFRNAREVLSELPEDGAERRLVPVTNWQHPRWLPHPGILRRSSPFHSERGTRRWSFR